MPSVQLKTREGQDYPSVPPEEQGWQEIVSTCLGPYPHHFMVPPTWEFLSFSAQQNFRARGLRWCSFRAPPWRTGGAFALEPTNLFAHTCYCTLRPVTASAAVQCINLILGAPFALLLAGKSLSSPVISEALCCSPSFVLFCFTELSLSFAFVFLQ